MDLLAKFPKSSSACACSLSRPRPRSVASHMRRARPSPGGVSCATHGTRVNTREREKERNHYLIYKLRSVLGRSRVPMGGLIYLNLRCSIEGNKLCQLFRTFMRRETYKALVGAFAFPLFELNIKL